MAIWRADIFVSIEGEEEFKLQEDYFLLTDFGKTKYKLDFAGKVTWDTYKRTEKQQATAPCKKWGERGYRNFSAINKH